MASVRVLETVTTESLAGEELERNLSKADPWVQDFVAAKRLGTRTGRIPKASTLANYVRLLNIARSLDLPDLKTCTLQDLEQFLQRFRNARCRHNVRENRPHSQAYYTGMVAILKQALMFHGRKDLNEEIRVPAPSDRETRIKEQVLKDDQVKLLIEKAPTLRDRVLVSMFDELGNRRGEMWNLRIKDVQFDEYSAILTLTGKTGTRTRRVYSSVPDSRAWLNNHPYKDNPNAPLFLSRYNQGFTRPSGIYVVIANMSEKILGVRVRTHQFRHTKATRDSRLFTDREMMSLFGWSKPDVIKVYSHLSGKDVDDKDLVLHGLKTKEEILRPIMQVQTCKECGEQNAPIAMYCVKCGKVLGPQARDETMQQMQQQIDTLKGQFELVLKTKITK